MLAAVFGLSVIAQAADPAPSPSPKSKSAPAASPSPKSKSKSKTTQHHATHHHNVRAHQQMTGS